MFTQIHIKNFTIIDELDLDVSSGLTVLTGETGAGKSIVIDAIELALGQRANSSIVRHGTDRADISVSFNIQNNQFAKECLKKYEIDHDDECLIRRVIDKEGRSKSFINGLPTTLQPLKELADTLINIHGQHEFQSLLKRDLQRQMLDDFADHAELMNQCNNIYYEWRKLNDEFDKLNKASNDITARADFLSYQIKELNDLNLGQHELEELNQEHKQLSHADTLISHCQNALLAITEDEQYSASNLLNRALQSIDQVQAIDRNFKNAADCLNNAIIQADEAANELNHYLQQMDVNPERLSWLDERLGMIHQLARKHRIHPEELFDFHQQMKKEYEQLEHSDESLQKLQAEINHLSQQYFDTAKKLTTSRKKAAKEFCKTITNNMQILGMPGGRFDIEFEALSNEIPSLNGMEKTTFVVSANPGQPLQPLNKVASGGELSRISLAIQVIAAKQSNIPSLIFDEVDSGIGGATADIVGQLLKELGNNTQVFCITHLAQVASKGHQHLQVLKVTDNEQTITKIKYLNDDDRTKEIARMIGGIKITKQTLAHAMEMLTSTT